MNNDTISVCVELDRTSAEALLAGLDQRLTVLQEIESKKDKELYLAAQKEKAGLISLIMALEAVLNVKSQAEH